MPSFVPGVKLRVHSLFIQDEYVKTKSTNVSIYGENTNLSERVSMSVLSTYFLDPNI